MLALRYMTGVGYSSAAPTELQVVVRTVNAGKPPLVFCHGANDSAMSVFGKTAQVELIRQLAQDYTVVVADLGLQVWGNPTHISRVSDAVSYLSGLGLTQPPTLVGVSMGGLGALGYARANQVKAVVGVIPALDIADLRTRGFASSIDAMYGGAYDDEVHGPIHSPVRYAETLDVPIHILSASNDALTVPSTVDDFLAKRPQTSWTNLGALGHTESAISAAVTPATKWLDSIRL